MKIGLNEALQADKHDEPVLCERSEIISPRPHYGRSLHASRSCVQPPSEAFCTPAARTCYHEDAPPALTLSSSMLSQATWPAGQDGILRWKPILHTRIPSFPHIPKPVIRPATRARASALEAVAAYLGSGQDKRKTLRPATTKSYLTVSRWSLKDSMLTR